VPTTEPKQDTTLRAIAQPERRLPHDVRQTPPPPANTEAGFAARFVAAVEGFRRAQVGHLV
jgi:hypothetical protein